MIKAAAVLLIFCAAPASASGPDLILYNGKIFIAPGQYAQAVSVVGRRIAAVGENKKILSRARAQTRRIDLAGRAVTPGFHDAHVHFVEGALLHGQLDLPAAMTQAVALARSVGVTSLSGPLVKDGLQELEVWAELHRQDKVTLRYWMWGRLDAPSDFLAAKEKFSRSLPSAQFHWSGLKGWVDGDFDSWSAALFEPYADKPDSRGRMRYTSWELKEAVVRGHKLGFPIRLHAIGDRAVRTALRACSAFLERGAKKRAARTPAPCVIEHADLVSEPDVRVFKTLGVVASVQPSRLAGGDDIPAYPQRLGQRASRTFAVRSLQSAGVEVAFGSDWPDRSLNPLLALFAATVRQGPQGSLEGGATLTERIFLEDAIVHHTVGPARVVGADFELGVIRAGYLADLVIFDQDIFSMQGKDLLKARVDATIFDGRVVYEREPSSQPESE